MHNINHKKSREGKKKRQEDDSDTTGTTNWWERDELFPLLTERGAQYEAERQWHRSRNQPAISIINPRSKERRAHRSISSRLAMTSAFLPLSFYNPCTSRHLWNYRTRRGDASAVATRDHDDDDMSRRPMLLRLRFLCDGEVDFSFVRSVYSWLVVGLNIPRDVSSTIFPRKFYPCFFPPSFSIFRTEFF